MKKKVEKKSWKKSWKMERLNFENLGFAKMKKKTSTSVFAYCSKWFRNWIPFIHTSESQIQQLEAFFFESNYCNLKCDCEWIRIPFLFLENSFANVSNSILYVQKWKSFWRLHPPFENKKGRMKSCLQWLHSTLSSLSYVF